MIPSQFADLLPGLPDSLVSTLILPRLAWQDIGSAVGVNEAWRSALLAHSMTERQLLNSTKIAIIHPAQRGSHCSPQSTQLSHTHSINSRAANFAISLYDVDSNSWEQLPPIPALAFGVPMGARCIYVEGRLYIVGGRNPLNWDFMSAVYALDLRGAQRRWRSCISMHTPRSDFACVQIGAKILVAGGQGEESLCLASVEIYDVRIQRWEKICHLNFPRKECVGAVIDDFVYIIGGYTSSSVNEDEHYCPEDDSEPRTFWVSSADCIQFGSQKWKTVLSGSMNDKLLHACKGVSLCGTLGYVHGSLVSDLWERCNEDWNVIDGKIIKRADTVSTTILMVSIIYDTQVFATRSCCTRSDLQSKRVSMSVSLVKLQTDPADKTHHRSRKWQKIACPFELNQLPLACCLVQL